MLNILIVDDVALIRQSIKSALNTESDLNFYEAANVLSAKMILETKQIDLLFLDLNLTMYKDKKDDDQNGLEIVRFINASEFKAPYISIISGSVNGADVKTALSLGVRDLIVKPYKREDILKRVENIRVLRA